MLKIRELKLRKDYFLFDINIYYMLFLIEIRFYFYNKVNFIFLIKIQLFVVVGYGDKKKKLIN